MFLKCSGFQGSSIMSITKTTKDLVFIPICVNLTSQLSEKVRHTDLLSYRNLL